MEEEPDASESDADGSHPSLEPSPARSDPTHPASGLALAIGILRRIRPFLSAGRSASACCSSPSRHRLDRDLRTWPQAGFRHADGRRPGACPPHGPAALRQRHGGGRPVRLSRAGRPARDGGLRGRADGRGWPATSASSRPSRRGNGTSCSRCSTRASTTAVVNGYEWTEQRARDYLATRPYYVYQLQLMVRRGSPIRTLGRPEEPEARRRPVDGRRAGGLGRPTPSPPRRAEPNVRAVRFDGATDAMTAVQNGQYDATLQDLPAARFYAGTVPGPGAGRAARVARVLRDLRPREATGRSATRWTRASPGWSPRASCAGSTSVTASGPRPRTSWPGSKGPIEPAPGQRVDRRLAAGATLPAPAARRGLGDRGALRHLDADRDGARPVHRDRPAVRAAGRCG